MTHRGIRGPRIRLGVFAVASVLVPALSGCYGYRAITADQAPEGMVVRARLADTEIDRLQLRDLIPLEDQTVEGTVQPGGSSELRLLVPLRPDGGWTTPRQSLNQLIAIDRAGVMEVEVRELERGQTLLVTGIGAAALTAILIDNLTGWFGGGREAYGPDKDGIM